MTGDKEFDEILSRLRGLPKLVAKAAPEAAKACAAVVASNNTAQRDPDGKPWPKTKNGAPALAGAMKNVSVSAVGSTILFRVVGPEALHHLGTARGHVQRKLIPVRKLPAAMAEAIKGAVKKVLES